MPRGTRRIQDFQCKEHDVPDEIEIVPKFHGLIPNFSNFNVNNRRKYVLKINGHSTVTMNVRAVRHCMWRKGCPY